MLGVDVFVQEETWTPGSFDNVDTYYVYASDALEPDRRGWLPALCFAVGAVPGDVEDGVIVQEFDRVL